MANAVCDKCGNVFRWHACRGSKLVDILSPCCGTTAHAKKANRTSYSSIVCKVASSLLAKGAMVERKRRISLMPDGGIWLTYRHYHPYGVDTCFDSSVIHVFKTQHGATAILSDYDYQRLLAKSQKEAT